MLVKSVYIRFLLLDVTTLSLTPFSFLIVTLLWLLLCCPLFLCLIPLTQNLPLCCLSLPLPSLLFPAFTPPPSSSLLQVVKWILLSQSHQGKSRKRKRIEPKVNYKKVGGTRLYWNLYLPSLCSTSNSCVCPFLFWKCLPPFLSGSSALLKYLYSICVCLSTQLSPVLFMCCVYEDRLPCTCLSLCLCCVVIHIFNLLRACIHHMPSTVTACVVMANVCRMVSVFVWRGWETI